MTELLKKAFARLLLGFADRESGAYQLSDEQLQEVELAKNEAREGRFATESEMAHIVRSSKAGAS